MSPRESGTKKDKNFHLFWAFESVKIMFVAAFGKHNESFFVPEGHKHPKVTSTAKPPKVAVVL
ncbi:hypothetical protein skT53_11840 [Effusibacillus dendaii]|uniref:Uncharacterized protein n=1 Tax=Effusibacillus dendaii TaxID=2743772 RepID=A0A7I8DB60_9BACL|nr:hypothetical protein skT53_11840 [Effusibacillus dendaii]